MKSQTWSTKCGKTQELIVTYPEAPRVEIRSHNQNIFPQTMKDFLGSLSDTNDQIHFEQCNNNPYRRVTCT